MLFNNYQISNGFMSYIDMKKYIPDVCPFQYINSSIYNDTSTFCKVISHTYTYLHIEKLSVIPTPIYILQSC